MSFEKFLMDDFLTENGLSSADKIQEALSRLANYYITHRAEFCDKQKCAQFIDSAISSVERIKAMDIQINADGFSNYDEALLYILRQPLFHSLQNEKLAQCIRFLETFNLPIEKAVDSFLDSTERAIQVKLVMLKGISHVPSKIKLLARIGPLLQMLDDVKVINEYLSVFSECIKSLERSEKEALMNCCLPRSFVQRILRSNNMRELLSVESKVFILRENRELIEEYIDIVANNVGECIEDAALILSQVSNNITNVEDYPELMSAMFKSRSSHSFHRLQRLVDELLKISK